MVDVIGVHGISQQQLGPNQLMDSWQPAAMDGLLRALPGHPGRPTVRIAFYGDVFLKQAESKGAPVETDIGDVDDDILAFLKEIQEDYAGDEPPDRKGAKKGLGSLPGPLTKLGAYLERRFGVASKVLFFGDLPQVRKYQRDLELAETIRKRVTDEITTVRPHVLLGHSLGSIVAYEVLCTMPDHGVGTFVTIGSPLGLRSIREALGPSARRRIPALPPGVDQWFNVYDPRDPVALAGGLSPIWTQVQDSTVDNESEAHSATRYLGKRQVGAALANGLGLG